MITARRYRDGAGTDVESKNLADVVASGDVIWVNVEEPSEEDLECIGEQFDLHPLALEDVRQHGQRPKLEHYENHVFIVAYSTEPAEIDIFVGPNWVITVRENPSDNRAKPGPRWNVNNAIARFERLGAARQTTGFLLHAFLDDLVDGYFLAIDALEDKLESLEDSIFAEERHKEHALQSALFNVRRELLIFRRVSVPSREVVNAILRREVNYISDDELVHYQDVYDHILRVIDSIDSLRELVGNSVDAHLAIISNQMNQVMKKMTSFGAILLGATLVAGIYGMNFKHMPELQWYLGYPFALGLMLIITIVGTVMFRRKDWL